MVGLGPYMTITHASRLLAWYDRHRRTLPWRAPAGERPSPYRVWLSEIMLQQTTVADGRTPISADFVARWPTVEALAAAPLDSVLAAWAGLGYYARARNLHACARAVAERARRALPGRRSRPAAPCPASAATRPAAIARHRLRRAGAVVDGNVERVIARLFAIETPLPDAKPEMQVRAAGWCAEERAGDYAQAMMDLGATVCTPRNRRCVICPF